MILAFLFRQPPAVGDHHHSRMNDRSEFGFSLRPAPLSLDPYPIPVFYPEGAGRLRMNFHNGIRVYFAQPGNLTMFTMEQDGRTSPGHHNKRKLLPEFRGP